MFDKIFKTVALLILAFIAYTLYLYTLNTRYYPIGGRSVLDRQTGYVYFQDLLQSRPQ